MERKKAGTRPTRDEEWVVRHVRNIKGISFCGRCACKELVRDVIRPLLVSEAVQTRFIDVESWQRLYDLVR